MTSGAGVGGTTLWRMPLTSSQPEPIVPLVLASASPARLATLRGAGVDPIVTEHAVFWALGKLI